MRIDSISLGVRAYLEMMRKAAPTLPVDVDDELLARCRRDLELHHAHEKLSDEEIADRALARAICLTMKAAPPLAAAQAPDAPVSGPAPAPSTSAEPAGDAGVELVWHELNRLRRQLAQDVQALKWPIYDIVFWLRMIVLALLLIFVGLVVPKAHAQNVNANIFKLNGYTYTGFPYDNTNQAFRVNVVAGGGAGGTSSTFGAAFPGTGTAIGVKNGANMTWLTADASNNLNVNCAVGCSAAADTVGSTVALNALNATASVALAGQGGVGLFLAAGTLVGTIVPEISYDGGTTWVASLFYDPAAQTTAASIVFGSANGATTRTVLAGGGASHARVRVSAFTSGSGSATLRATTNAGGLATYITNTVTVSVSNTVTVAGTVTANQGGAPWSQNLTQIGGAALAFGQAAMAGSIPVVIASNQSAVPASQNGTWNINAVTTVSTVTNLAQIAGVAPTFGDANNVASISGFLNTAPGFRYNATQPTLTDGRWNLGQLSSRGELLVAPGVSGFSVTANAGTNLNTSALALETGGHLAAIDTNAGAQADAAVTSDVNGSLSAKLRGLVKIFADVWDSGNHWLKVSIQNATLAVTQSGTWTVRVLGNAGAIFDGVVGSTAPANAVQIGITDGTNTRVPIGDPCSYGTWNKFVVNTATNAQIVAGSAAKNVYICKMVILPAPAAANVNIVEGTGATCGTGTAGMLGGATAALGANLAVNGGFALPADNHAWTSTATSGDSVCLFASAQVSGVLWYVGPV